MNKPKANSKDAQDKITRKKTRPVQLLEQALRIIKEMRIASNDIYHKMIRQRLVPRGEVKAINVVEYTYHLPPEDREWIDKIHGYLKRDMLNVVPKTYVTQKAAAVRTFRRCLNNEPHNLLDASVKATKVGKFSTQETVVNKWKTNKNKPAPNSAIDTVRDRTFGFFHDDGQKAFTCVDVGNRNVLTCEHVTKGLDPTKLGSYLTYNSIKRPLGGLKMQKVVKTHKSDGIALLTHTVGAPTNKPLKVSRKDPFAILVERGRENMPMIVALPLHNVKWIKSAIINGVERKGQFWDYDNDTVAGDSGAPIVDIFGNLVGLHFATGLGVPIPDEVVESIK